MKTLLKLEYLALFAFSIFLFSNLTYSWWVFPVFLLAPDVGMIGYIVNPKIGAITYNFTHWLAVGFVSYIAGSFLGFQILELIGIIIVAHASMDRILGYGLKYPDSFKNTHLGNL